MAAGGIESVLPASQPATATWVAGIVHHAAHDDLERCLASIRSQAAAPLATVVADTDTDPRRLAEIQRLHREVRFESGPNRGYAGGANRILTIVSERWPSAHFVLLLNADVEIEPLFASVLMAALAQRPRVAIASGKLLRPGGRIIDSAGIRLPSHRRPRDRGSEEPDRGQYDRSEIVFGVSGAAMMLRRSALPQLALGGEIFDEDFFLYHEDTDLCWRAARLGWEVLFAPEARAIHRRGWQVSHRMRIASSVRRHSFKNHYLQILKNESASNLVRSLPVLLLWELLRLGFALSRDPAVLGGYAAAARLAPRAWRKRRELRKKIRAQTR